MNEFLLIIALIFGVIGLIARFMPKKKKIFIPGTSIEVILDDSIPEGEIHFLNKSG